MESKDLDNIKDYLRDIDIQIRVNNLIISKFILQLSEVRKELHLPERKTYFKFELLQDDYNELAKEFGYKELDKALYRLDRLLAKNKQHCPNNIRKYIYKKLKTKSEKQDEKE